MKITATQLRAIAPMLSLDRAQVLADAINIAAPLYQVTTPLRMAGILARMVVESNSFQAKSESLDYSAERLQAVFSYYKNHPKLAEEHGRTPKHKANQQLIANSVYADTNRPVGKKLGNTQPGDGWLFRGAGPMQSTGRAIITKYAAYKGLPVEEVVGLLRSDDQWGIDNAFWVFVVEKKLLDEADRGDIDAISKAINGDVEGMKETRIVYGRAKKALGI